MVNADTLNAMNADQSLILIRENYTFMFWLILTTGIGSFAIYKMTK